MKASRHEIAQGAAEMQVDEFLNSALSERPKTKPPIAARNPAERELRATQPGIGIPTENAPVEPPRSQFWGPEAERDDESPLAKTIPLGTHHAPRAGPRQPLAGGPTGRRDTRPFEGVGEGAASQLLAQREGKIAELEGEVERLRAQMRAEPSPPGPAHRQKAATVRPDQTTFLTSPIAADPRPPEAFSARASEPPGGGATQILSNVPAHLLGRESVVDDSHEAAALQRFGSAGRSHTVPMQRADLPAPAAAAPAPPQFAVADAIASAILEAQLTPTIEIHPSEPPPPAPLAPTFDLPADLPAVLRPRPVALAPAIVPPAAAPAPEPAPPIVEPRRQVEALASAPTRGTGASKARPALMVALAVCAVAMAGSAYAYRIGFGPFARGGLPPAAPVAEAAAPVAEASPPEPTTVAAAKPTPTPSPIATGAPSPSVSASDAPADASAAPSAAPSASAAPAPPEPTAPTVDEALGLLSFQAHLTVTSSLDAEVVVQGQAAGKTNQRVLTRCGPRNVRLRAATGEWLTAGQHVQITCMKHTSISIER